MADPSLAALSSLGFFPLFFREMQDSRHCRGDKSGNKGKEEQ
ncbi:hypothetical protein [Leptospira wolffii]|nr:hypothetical protein [Leptospira wolffii]